MTANENKDKVENKAERKSSFKSYNDPNVSDSKTKRDRIKSLRILIVEPQGRYCRTVWCAIGVGVSHFMLGAIVMTMLIYSIKIRDEHVSVCTIAYHFFSAEAILSLNYANGWSSPLRLSHRRFAHVFLQMCALVCAIVGTTLVMINKGVSDSVHGITGLLTTVLAGISFMSGPCALFGGHYLKILHMSVGMPTFLMSSICLCFGVYASTFRSWAGDTVVVILLLLRYSFLVLLETSLLAVNFELFSCLQQSHHTRGCGLKNKVKNLFFEVWFLSLKMFFINYVPLLSISQSSRLSYLQRWNSVCQPST